MKKYFIFAAAAVVAASCAKAPVPVQTPDGPEVPAVEGREAVQFGSNLIANVETKANGSVDAWGGQNLYIYGLKRIKVDGGSKSLFKGVTYEFIDNVKATAPASGTSDAIEVKKDNGEDFYYEGTSTYDFFGYYVDDAYKTDDAVAAPEPEARALSTTATPADSAIVLPIKINGGQDILLAKASADYAFNKLSNEDKKAYWTADNSQDWSSQTNNTWNSKYAFSAYAARRKVHPYLNFEHQLAQINFFVKSGTTFTDAEGHKVSPQLYVESVEFLDVNTTADLYIASSSADPQYKEGLHNEGTKGTIAVTQVTSVSDPARVALTKVTVPNKGEDNKEIGAATMLFPADSYSIEIKLSQDGTTYVQPIPVTLDPANIRIYNNESSNWETPNPAKTAFEAGYKYNVIVTVYGLEKIDITVELEKWGYGGEANLDTDEAPEF